MTKNLDDQKCESEPKPFAYSEAVKEHFLNPRNFLMGDGSKYACDAKGTVGNPVCGDQMTMYLQIKSRTCVGKLMVVPVRLLAHPHLANY